MRQRLMQDKQIYKMVLEPGDLSPNCLACKAVKSMLCDCGGSAKPCQTWFSLFCWLLIRNNRRGYVVQRSPSDQLMSCQHDHNLFYFWKTILEIGHCSINRFRFLGRLRSESQGNSSSHCVSNPTLSAWSWSSQ